VVPKKTIGHFKDCSLSFCLSVCVSICSVCSVHLQAYSAALQTQWQWVRQLCVCVEQHLKDNTAYFQVGQPAPTNPRAVSTNPGAVSTNPRGSKHQPQGSKHQPRGSKHQPQGSKHQPQGSKHQPQARVVGSIRPVEISA